jgi:DNA polymerase-3 subunit alpha/DNA polymerase-3 subunit epsilon
MILFLDTETTGINKAIDRIVQIAWIVADYEGEISHEKNFIIKPDGFYIPKQSTAIHGITNDIAEKTGDSLEDVLDELITDAEEAEILVAHNAAFDIGFLKGEFANLGIDFPFDELKIICTMMSSTNYCRLQKLNGMPGYKRPKLEELHFFLFNEYFNNAHDALADTEACMRCFYELVNLEIIPLNLKNLDYKSAIKEQHDSISKNLQLEVANLKGEIARLTRELASNEADIEQTEFWESPEGIFWLARHSDDVYWKIAVLKHPECPKEIVLEIADEILKLNETPDLLEDALLEALIKNKLTPNEKLKLIFSESCINRNFQKKILKI